MDLSFFSHPRGVPVWSLFPYERGASFCNPFFPPFSLVRFTTRFSPTVLFFPFFLIVLRRTTFLPLFCLGFQEKHIFFFPSFFLF